METIEQTEIISIKKEDYLNLLNRLEKVEKSINNFNEEIINKDFYNTESLDDCHKLSENSLSKNWNSKEDEEAFHFLQNKKTLDKLIKNAI